MAWRGYNSPRSERARARSVQDSPTMNTTIGKGITITGSIQAQEPVTIAGIVNGDVLVSDYDVTVEPGARVDGAVTARNITVRGRSSGRLIARQLVRVQQGAAVRADIAAPRLALEEGAI